MARTVVLATGNLGKLGEFQRLLGDNLTLIPQSEFNIEPVEETGTTFTANALLKARNAAALTQHPAIADDSGLEVDALGGAPGVYSARFAGPDSSDADNNALLLERLAGVPERDRTARFCCVLAYVDSPDDAQPLIVEGRWEGRIASTPSGHNGFGYDPLFVDPELGATSAELDPAVKNARSHRGQAAHQLRRELQRRFGPAPRD